MNDLNDRPDEPDEAGTLEFELEPDAEGDDDDHDIDIDIDTYQTATEDASQPEPSAEPAPTQTPADGPADDPLTTMAVKFTVPSRRYGLPSFALWLRERHFPHERLTNRQLDALLGVYLAQWLPAEPI